MGVFSSANPLLQLKQIVLDNRHQILQLVLIIGAKHSFGRSIILLFFFQITSLPLSRMTWLENRLLVLSSSLFERSQTLWQCVPYVKERVVWRWESPKRLSECSGQEHFSPRLRKTSWSTSIFTGSKFNSQQTTRQVLWTVQCREHESWFNRLWKLIYKICQSSCWSLFRMCYCQ